MQIILLDKVVNLGNLGEVVKVEDGCALFDSVTNHDISAELTKDGLPVLKSQIRMPNGPLETVDDPARMPKNASVFCTDNLATSSNPRQSLNHRRVAHINYRLVPLLSTTYPQLFTVQSLRSVAMIGM